MPTKAKRERKRKRLERGAQHQLRCEQMAAAYRERTGRDLSPTAFRTFAGFEALELDQGTSRTQDR